MFLPSKLLPSRRSSSKLPPSMLSSRARDRPQSAGPRSPAHPGLSPDLSGQGAGKGNPGCRRTDPPRNTRMQTHNMALKWVEPRQGRPRYRTVVDGRPFPGQTGPQHFSGPARKNVPNASGISLGVQLYLTPRCGSFLIRNTKRTKLKMQRLRATMISHTRCRPPKGRA